MKTCKMAALAASISLALAGAAAMAATPAPPAATALPGQGAVTAGAATGTVTGSTLAVVLTANSVINWGGASPTINKTGTAGFNVGSSAEVDFTGAFGVLNVDTSGSPSQIFGTMTSVGDLYVANANGIIVGSGASITGGGAVGLIGNTLANANGTAFTNSAYPATVSYLGTGGDVTVQPSASITGGTVLISGGGNVNVDLGSLTAGAASLRAGIPNTANPLVTANAGASLTVRGTLGGATLDQLASAGTATSNGVLDTANMTFGIPYAPGMVNYPLSDVAGTFTNNGAVNATAAGYHISGAIVNNGKFDATGKSVQAGGGISNLGTLNSQGITSAAFSNQGDVTDTGGVVVTGGDFNNAGSLSTGAVTVVDGGIVNSGKLTVSGGSVQTVSDGDPANGFAAGANYSIANTGTINSPASLTLAANWNQSGGTPNPANGSTGGINSSGVLQVGTVGSLTLLANNNVSVTGAVQTPHGSGFASTDATHPLGSLLLGAGAYGNTAAYGAGGANVFNATGGVTLAPDIFLGGGGIAAIEGNWVALMGNLGGDSGSGSFSVAGSPSAVAVTIIAGASPDTGYAVRVAGGKTVEAGAIVINGDQAGDTPNVILQGSLASHTIILGGTHPLGDVFSGAAGGLQMWNAFSPATPVGNAALVIDSVGRVKAAPYLNDANFRFNGLPVTLLDGSTVNLTVSADDMQGTPTSGYNLLVNGGVNLQSIAASFAQIINGNGSAVTGVNMVPNSHFVLQSTGDITTFGNFYWPGYIYLGNINTDSDGNAAPGTPGLGTITLGGNFSNVLPGDTAGASGIHFITQFPMTLGGTVTTNANAWVNFGSDALTQLYSGANGATGPFFGGAQGPGNVINYGPLPASSFVTQVPDPNP